MTAFGLLIDYEYCSGCQSCEVSCKEEHGYPVGKWGIRVMDDGPWEIEPGHMNWNKVPIPTDLCDLCAERTAKGREPACVHHCLADVMKYGPVAELAAFMEEKPKQVLFVPQYKPYEARGAFVSARKDDASRRRAAAMEVDANAQVEFATHRDDSDVRNVEELNEQ